jgi:ribulose-phosphate 3-epimerase
LADQLRESIEYLKTAWCTDGVLEEPPSRPKRAAVASVQQAPDDVKVFPSVMCVDFCHFEEGVRELEAAGADVLHVDMADGHFVPNLLLGVDVVRALVRTTSLPVDVHLMVENPDDYVERMAECGVDMVSVHAEACGHLDRTLTEIRARGMKAGVALNPATPLDVMEYVRERLDFVLLMTVNPGFAGQKLVAGAFRKIADCRRFLDGSTASEVAIMVDGNVSFENIPKMVAAGADILIAGTSSWFSREQSLEENVRRTQEAIARGLKSRTGESVLGNPQE